MKYIILLAVYLINAFVYYFKYKPTPRKTTIVEKKNVLTVIGHPSDTVRYHKSIHAHPGKVYNNSQKGTYTIDGNPASM